jgi:hypothetical protein
MRRAVANEHLAVKLARKRNRAGRLSLNHRDFVPALVKLARKIHPDFAAPGNDYVSRIIGCLIDHSRSMWKRFRRQAIGQRLIRRDVHLLDDHRHRKECGANHEQLRIFLGSFSVAWFIDACDRARNVINRPRNLRRHQIDVIVASNRKQNVGFADAGFTLNIDVDSIALNQLDAFKLRRAAQTAGFLIYDCYLVASIEE